MNIYLPLNQTQSYNEVINNFMIIHLADDMAYDISYRLQRFQKCVCIAFESDDRKLLIPVNDIQRC